MKKLIGVLAASCCGFASYSQSVQHTLQGRIMDASSQKALEYATITLKNMTGKSLNGAVSDNKGKFKLSNVPSGKYLVQVDFIAYYSKTDTIQLSEPDRNINLPVIFLQPKGTSLSEVTVVSKLPLVENKIDKIVYNAANDVSSQGGVALDVLKKVPQVSVDIDGNVELLGNSSIRFLINGKPSTVFGNNLTDVLSSIPASQIKSIEAISSPGARYDAEGTGGIINIILKDSKVKGINGTVNGSLGSRLENGSANLNFRNNGFGMHFFFSGNAQLSSQTPSQYGRYSDSTKLLQDGTSSFNRGGFESGWGFDWDLSKTDNLSGSFGYNHFSSAGSGLTQQEQYTKNGAMSTDLFSTRNSSSESSSKAFEWNLAYRKKLKRKGEELNLQYNDSYDLPNSNYWQYQVYKGEVNPFTGAQSNNPGTDRETEIALDYTRPVNDQLELEAGLKTVFRAIHSNADVLSWNPSVQSYTYDPTQSYQISYHRTIYAGYISANYPIGKLLDMKTGVRFEYTTSSIDYAGTQIPPYRTLAPSIMISHSFENGNTIKLAYSHRIERPDYREINPFYNLSDPYNITTGNPALQPEQGNNIELGYNF
ncbi:MAG TPA: TonB-dependent receptor, partial [Sediminibacterium sp.]|nr:TonB-dependent receptor [Sediminibacterium sp.]